MLKVEVYPNEPWERSSTMMTLRLRIHDDDPAPARNAPLRARTYAEISMSLLLPDNLQEGSEARLMARCCSSSSVYPSRAASAMRKPVLFRCSLRAATTVSVRAAFFCASPSSSSSELGESTSRASACGCVRARGLLLAPPLPPPSSARGLLLPPPLRLRLRLWPLPPSARGLLLPPPFRLGGKGRLSPAGQNLNARLANW